MALQVKCSRDERIVTLDEAFLLKAGFPELCLSTQKSEDIEPNVELYSWAVKMASDWLKDTEDIIPDEQEVIIKVFEVAWYFDLEGLMNHCFTKLPPSINASSIAYLHHDARLVLLDYALEASDIVLYERMVGWTINRDEPLVSPRNSQIRRAKVLRTTLGNTNTRHWRDEDEPQRIVEVGFCPGLDPEFAWRYCYQVGERNDGRYSLLIWDFLERSIKFRLRDVRHASVGPHGFLYTAMSHERALQAWSIERGMVTARCDLPWYATVFATDTSLLTLPHGRSMFVHHDQGPAFAWARNEPTLALEPMDSLLPHDASVACYASDGSFVVYATSSTIDFATSRSKKALVDLTTSMRITHNERFPFSAYDLFPDRWAWILDIAISPNKTSIALLAGSNLFFVRTQENIITDDEEEMGVKEIRGPYCLPLKHIGSTLWNRPGHYTADRIHCLAYSPDSRYLAAVSRDGSVFILENGEGSIEELIFCESVLTPGSFLHARAVAWSKDGELLVVACNEGVVSFDIANTIRRERSRRTILRTQKSEKWAEN